ncbi:MAG TPA: hypothetical protein VKI65_17620, partial [Gemmataceae bacterium]|nr:hypothetical protein [Gemmataceae bacterium]
HAERPHRAFVVAPPLNGWVSIFERGEFREIALAEFLSKELSTYVAASLWEEHTGEQIFHGFRGGHLEDAFIQEHFQAKVSKMGALSNVTPERFALDEYMHVELQITIGYCTTFSDMFLHPEEACSLAEMLYLSFRRD